MRVDVSGNSNGRWRHQDPASIAPRCRYLRTPGEILGCLRPKLAFYDRSLNSLQTTGAPSHLVCNCSVIAAEGQRSAPWDRRPETLNTGYQYSRVQNDG